MHHAGHLHLLLPAGQGPWLEETLPPPSLGMVGSEPHSAPPLALLAEAHTPDLYVVLMHVRRSRYG